MTGYLALEDSSTVVGAWLNAVSALRLNKSRAYNLVYTVTSPELMTESDRRVVAEFNEFVRDGDLHSTETVANTIFPLDTFRSQGSDEFYKYYLSTVFPKVRKQWGTYFERMIRRRNDDGSVMLTKDGPFNPLQHIVKKVGRRLRQGGTTTHFEVSLDDPAFDISTYNAHHDAAYQIGGPCLSHVSFKLDGTGALRMTAFYRSHWYVARALGNLIGLARLQTFVARQSGAEVGPLTIVASEAVLDLSGKGRSTSATRIALERCGEIAKSP